MDNKSINRKIEDKIKILPKGKILFITDFIQYGSDMAIRQALKRLTEKDIIVRLSSGIYYSPKTDKLLGIIKPSTDQIAEAIAKRDKARIIPTGSYALYKLGLSTQIPMNAVYLTDGSARKIEIGKQKIIFKKTSPKNLAVKHNLSNLIIQGLKELKEENITIQIRSKLKVIIVSSNEQDKILNNIRYAPVRIQKVIHKIIKELNDEQLA